MSIPARPAATKHGLTPTTGVGVLDRSMAVLGAVEGGARSFTDIVASTGLTRPTAHRLLKALEAHGLLTLQAGHGYRLGPHLLRLAAGAMRDLPLRDLAHPELERLARATGESAQLYVRDLDRRICIDSVQSDSELRTIVDVGAALPLSAGSAGKVFLAFGSENLRAKMVGAAKKVTQKTPVGGALTRQLATIRRQGYATSAGERQPGVGSVSAPISDPGGQLLAVVSVSGPESRLGRAGRYAPAVLEAARRIELALGAGGEPA